MLEFFAFARSISYTNIYKYLNFKRQHEKTFSSVNVDWVRAHKLQITRVAIFLIFYRLQNILSIQNIYCAGDSNEGGGC